MEHSVMKPGYDYHFASSKLQESTHERDLGLNIVPNPSPGNHIKRVIKGVNYILFTAEIASKYTDKMFRKYLQYVLDPN